MDLPFSDTLILTGFDQAGLSVLFARPAPGVRLAGSGHLAVVLNAVALRRGAAALMAQHDRWGHPRMRLLQNVIRQRQGGARQF